jgi:hypothetical protein
VGPDPAWGFGLGGAAFVLGVTILGFGVHARGRTFARLADAVDLAFAGLAERALEQLRSLQRELNETLPAARGTIDPGEIVFDPGRLEQPARSGVATLRRQRRVRTEFRWLLRVCSVIKYVAAGFLVADLAATACYFFVFQNPYLWTRLAWITAGVAGVGCLLLTAYVYLNTRVETSIERARPNPGARSGT